MSPRPNPEDQWQRDAAIARLLIDQPGWTRAELARSLYLSERQVQADLERLRRRTITARVPLLLIRREGYRLWLPDTAASQAHAPWLDGRPLEDA